MNFRTLSLALVAALLGIFIVGIFKSKHEGVAHFSEATNESQRIPHQNISTQQAYFSVPSEAKRQQTYVSFYYRAGALEDDTLQLKEATGPVPVCLVTNPLVASTTWNSTSSGPLRLYVKNQKTTFETLGGLPLLADDAAAHQFGLKANSYSQLEGATATGTAEALLTTYNPPVKDGTWNYFRCLVDATAADTSENNTLQWQIVRRNFAEPLQLGEVHINYQLPLH